MSESLESGVFLISSIPFLVVFWVVKIEGDYVSIRYGYDVIICDEKFRSFL